MLCHCPSCPLWTIQFLDYASLLPTSGPSYMLYPLPEILFHPLFAQPISVTCICVVWDKPQWTASPTSGVNFNSVKYTSPNPKMFSWTFCWARPKEKLNFKSCLRRNIIVSCFYPEKLPHMQHELWGAQSYVGGGKHLPFSAFWKAKWCWTEVALPML